MTTNKIIERIERETGMPGLAYMLAEKLSPTDLQSLLMDVYRRRMERLQPAAVLNNQEQDRFARPAALSPLTLLAWERTALAELSAEVEPLILSPVTALGTNAAVALVDQNKMMSTIYNTEVVSDSTNVLALEAALRRRKLLKQNPKSSEAVHLAASHRLLRTQNYGNPNSLAHFSAIALCSSGRDQGNFRFEVETLVIHIEFYLRALRAYLGNDIPLRVAITDFSAEGKLSPLIDEICAKVSKNFPATTCEPDQKRESGRGYYVNLCYHIYFANAAGQDVEIGDGGVVDWTQKLLNNAKERCVTSGIGSDRVCVEFESRNPDLSSRSGARAD
jgi:hypothetical protein